VVDWSARPTSILALYTLSSEMGTGDDSYAIKRARVEICVAIDIDTANLPMVGVRDDTMAILPHGESFTHTAVRGYYALLKCGGSIQLEEGHE
jgi:hypothetical protein